MLTSIYKIRNYIYLPKELSEIVLLNDIIWENVYPIDFIFNVNRDIIKWNLIIWKKSHGKSFLFKKMIPMWKNPNYQIIKMPCL